MHRQLGSKDLLLRLSNVCSIWKVLFVEENQVSHEPMFVHEKHWWSSLSGDDWCWHRSKSIVDQSQANVNDRSMTPFVIWIRTGLTSSLPSPRNRINLRDDFGTQLVLVAGWVICVWTYWKVRILRACWHTRWVNWPITPLPVSFSLVADKSIRRTAFGWSWSLTKPNVERRNSSSSASQHWQTFVGEFTNKWHRCIPIEMIGRKSVKSSEWIRCRKRVGSNPCASFNVVFRRQNFIGTLDVFAATTGRRHWYRTEKQEDVLVRLECFSFALSVMCRWSPSMRWRKETRSDSECCALNNRYHDSRLALQVERNQWINTRKSLNRSQDGSISMTNQLPIHTLKMEETSDVYQREQMFHKTSSWLVPQLLWLVKELISVSWLTMSIRLGRDDEIREDLGWKLPHPQYSNI